MTREDAEDMLYDLMYLHGCYEEQQRRDDHVHWSPENEQAAFQKFYDAKEKIIDLMTKGDEEDDASSAS